MTVLVREVSDEREALLVFLAEQRDALRRAVHGLSDEQAAARPSASTLCLGGLLKHVAKTERSWIQVLLAGRPDPEPDRLDRWDEDFTMLPGETLSGWLATYAEVARESEEVIRGLADLGQTVALPGPPWLPPGVRRSARWILLHTIEETARHVGHADIIRESLDGATARQLVTVDGNQR
jgi:uncharacterized damage-inducible protein DinB